MMDTTKNHNRPRWEHYYHVADIGVRGYGSTPAEAFEQTAVALTAVITDPGAIEPHEQIAVNCEAPDRELLLADWLNVLIYEMATRLMLFSRFEVSLEGTRLTAKVWGEKVDLKKHDPAVEIKGATYTTLKVEQQEDGMWLAQCVVDV